MNNELPPKNFPAAVEGTALSGHRMIYDTVEDLSDPRGYRTLTHTAIHSPNCPCITDPENWH